VIDDSLMFFREGDDESATKRMPF